MVEMVAPLQPGNKGSRPRREDAGRPDWQLELSRAPRKLSELTAQLGLRPEVVDSWQRGAADFPVRVTDYYLGLADPADPDDPILRQVLPSGAEAEGPPGFSEDPVGDLLEGNHPAPGLVQKYPGRALLVTTGACATNCRFCFRRAYPYSEIREGGRRWAAALEVIASDPSIREVILSGGDPLSLGDGVLADLVLRLAVLPHVRRIRVHSRMPVVLPSRITGELVAALRPPGGPRVWLVTHFNHPRELTAQAGAACQRLQSAGIPVLNQSVLLRGVNDNEETLADLFEGLVDLGVKPYYLHQLDRVEGAAHFEVPEDEGRRLVDAVRRRVSGLAMPAWVRDIPGKDCKTLLSLLLVALLVGCSSSTTRPAEPPSQQVGGEEAPVASSSPIQLEPGPVDLLLAADLDGDGRAELLAGQGSSLRWGTWGSGEASPRWTGRFEGRGLLQEWVAADFDGDGAEEVVAAFGLGRGHQGAATEVVFLDGGPSNTVVAPIWRRRGERNQVTSLQVWPGGQGRSEIYVAAFSSRFMVEGGVLGLGGGEPDWLPSHRLRMGMVRALGDFDGDGVSEVAAGRLYGDEVDQPGDLRVLPGSSSSGLIPTERGVRAVAAADLDGDGRHELLFGDGWHKNYGKLARYRPSVARFVDGKWNVELVEERDDQYAVEKIGWAEGRLVVGGPSEVRVYRREQAGWQPVGAPQPSSAKGAWAVLESHLVLGGARLRRVPLP